MEDHTSSSRADLGVSRHHPNHQSDRNTNLLTSAQSHTTRSNLRVLVVGASIAGPMTAYWLARAGCTVTIIERFPSLRTGGQSVDIRNAGVTVMRKMHGMEATGRSKRPPIDAFTWVDDNGKPYAEMKPSGDADAQTLVSEFEIYRGDLSSIICDYLRPCEVNGKVKFIFNEQVSSISQSGDSATDDGPVTVSFLNGTPTAEYDLVVAADGSTSRTRALGFNVGVRDHIKPLNCWAAYFTAPQSLLPPGDPGAAHNAPPGRFFGIGQAPGGEGTKGITITALPENDSGATVPFREAQKQGDASLKQFVADHFRDAGWRANEIVKGMWDSKDFYASEIVQVKPPALSRGRFVLVGDAGYASGFIGTGTSLAMCGAYVLAGEVLAHAGDITAGLEAYEQRMAPIIKNMQTLPPGIRSFLAPQTHWGLAVRNVILRLVCFGMRFGKYFSWVTGWFGSAFAKDDFHLPEFEWVT